MGAAQSEQAATNEPAADSANSPAVCEMAPFNARSATATVTSDPKACKLTAPMPAVVSSKTGRATPKRAPSPHNGVRAVKVPSLGVPGPSSKPKRERPPCARAVFYDDNQINFEGIDPRGKVPAIRAVHCRVPLSITQMEGCIAAHDNSIADQPKLFVFFDFDGTLSLHAGVTEERWKHFSKYEDVFSDLFGDELRQIALRRILDRLLTSGSCYVLTANPGYVAIAQVLNKFLERGGSSERFLVDETMRYTPSGSKVRAIHKIVEQTLGYRLVASRDERGSV
jgi:hypothetical protein